MPPCYGRNHGTYYSQPRHLFRRNCRSIQRYRGSTSRHGRDQKTRYSPDHRMSRKCRTDHLYGRHLPNLLYWKNLSRPLTRGYTHATP